MWAFIVHRGVNNFTSILAGCQSNNTNGQARHRVICQFPVWGGIEAIPPDMPAKEGPGVRPPLFPSPT